MKYVLTLLIVCLGCQITPQTVSQVLSADMVVLADGTKVRYAGSESPLDGPWFAFSRDANAYLVQDKTVVCIVEPNLAQDEVVVAYLYTPILVDQETKYLFVNAELIKFGFAKALPPPKNLKHPELWQNLWDLQEEQAKPRQRGIWSGKPPYAKNRTNPADKAQ
ncbi:MAG: hypothetical protein HY808_15755 [Nitrospirae bacterium]|nr:hypothetical protein [Candidatus Woesearchaeota archaeon]MBI4850004.1 hypothetical protein [Nitrospirota bacterium]